MTDPLEQKSRKRILITIGGLPGSGTTTAAELLSKKINIPWTNGGSIFRELAKEKCMELNAFGRFAEGNPEVDKELDRKLIAIMRKGEIIVESRLAGANAMKNEIPAMRVYLHASFDTRVERIHDREGGSVEDIAEATRERERSEKKRYREYYDIDYENLDYYTLVINSGELWPEQIVNIIMEGLRTKGLL